MKHVVTGADHIFGPWLAERINSVYISKRGHTIGLLDEDKGPVACTYLESMTETCMSMHCAGEGKTWLNREYLWYCFYYPFIQAGMTKLVSPVAEDNLDCQRFIQHLGFSLEATLKDACPQGDLLLFSMTRAQCKWLSLKGSKDYGEAQRS